MKRKLKWDPENRYTPEEWKAIHAAVADLRVAEENARQAKLAWLRILAVPMNVGLSVHQIASLYARTRRLRAEARRLATAALRIYYAAVQGPYLAREMAGYIRGRLDAPSFAEQIFPAVGPVEVVGAVLFAKEGTGFEPGDLLVKKPSPMLKSKNEDAVKKYAEERGLRWGHCIFDSFYYAGTAEQLGKIGVIMRLQ